MCIHAENGRALQKWRDNEDFERVESVVGLQGAIIGSQMLAGQISNQIDLFLFLMNTPSIIVRVWMLFQK